MRKSLFILLTIFSFSYISCNQELDTIENIEKNAVLSVENRSSGIGWCDSESDPPAAYLLGFYEVLDPNTLENKCCVDLRFLSAYVGATVSLTVTQYNFNTMTGSPAVNYTYYSTVDSNGRATFCFTNIGSHILIQIYDSLGQVIACNTLEIDC